MRAKQPTGTGFVARDGVKLFYEIYGDGPETMLFVPPWSIVHSRVYKAQLPYFSERFRCIAYDARGNGKSDRPDSVAAYTLDQLVADAVAVMDGVGAAQAIVVEHDLHAFQAIRRMDELLVANFMTFQEAVEQTAYNLVIADEAWEIDHYWHEHPELKKAALAWLTDFVGFVPMPAGGEREAFLTADYNAEMIEHIARHPGVRDRAIFVGNRDDILPQSFGAGLPAMRDWIPGHFDFSGYILGRHPQEFGHRAELRQALGYRPDERVCIVTVGGSGVGAHLIKRILASYPMIKAKLPALRMIVVAGPRIPPGALVVPPGVELRAFVPDLDRHLAACDLALVQGGLTTCMELAAACTPFLYFPLRNHFEQNFHVAHRLEAYGAGIRMDYAAATPDVIADAAIAALRRPARFKPVEADGAERAAKMLAALL